MTTPLSQTLLDAARKPEVVADLVNVIDAEVKDKAGLSGAAIRAAYGTVKKVSPSTISSAVTKMLPDFATALDPFWNEFVASGESDFGQFLSVRSESASDALIAVTDKRAESTSQAVLKKAYKSIRGRAKDSVTAALPRLGTALQNHAK